ncbi:MAG: biotin/lipoyl-binding protein, partial [Desulfofustis sp.]|nr:biotin/lipoyl-binding protein [Desulfofustis sp.]
MPTNPVEGQAGKAPVEKIEASPAVDSTPPVESQPAAATTPPDKPVPAVDGPPPAEKKTSWKRWIILAVIALVLVIAVVTTLRFMNRGLPDGLIQANGRIEGDRVSVASKFPGRIARLLVREGDEVKSGQTLAVLEDTQIRARVSQARAAVTALAAQLQAAQTSLSVLKQDVQLGIDIAEAGVANAGAVLAKTQAADSQAALDAGRYRELLASGTVERHKSEMADLAGTSAASEREAARTGLIRAEKLLSQARLGADRIRAQSNGVTALAAQLSQGRAVQVEAESVLSDLTLVAPIDGVITTRVRDKG